jgi:hypothetical protein
MKWERKRRVSNISLKFFPNPFLPLSLCLLLTLCVNVREPACVHNNKCRFIRGVWKRQKTKMVKQCTHTIYMYNSTKPVLWNTHSRIGQHNGGGKQCNLHNETCTQKPQTVPKKATRKTHNIAIHKTCSRKPHELSQCLKKPPPKNT